MGDAGIYERVPFDTNGVGEDTGKPLILGAPPLPLI